MGVYKKGNRWYIDYYIPDPASPAGHERIREVVKIKGIHPSKITRQDARKTLSIRRAQVAEGKFEIAKPEKPILFENLMTKFLQWAKNNHRAYERDEAASKPLLAFFSGQVVQRMNLWMMEKYKMHRKAQGRHPETVNKELAMVRRMMNLAAGEELEDIKLKVNPLKGMKLYRVKKRPYRVYKDDEFKDLYQAAPQHFKIMLLLAYGAGMRKTEIRTLKLSQIDFEASSIVLTETKTDEPRTIPVDTVLLEKLKEVRDRGKSDYVCLTPNGKPYLSKTAWKTVWTNTFERTNKKRAKENKPPIKPGRFHDHRHTFISNLIVNEKEDFETVMKLSGHEDIRSLKHYTHTHEEAKRAAIKKIGDRLSNMALDTYMDTSPPEVQPELKDSKA